MPANQSNDPISTVATIGSSLPTQQEQLGKLSAASADAAAGVAQSKGALDKKTADFSGALTKQAGDRFLNESNAVKFETPPQFHTPQETLAGFASLFTLLGTLAFAGGARSRTNGMGAMAAMTGALKGWHQGEVENYNRAMNDYNANLKRITMDNQVKQQQLQQIERAWTVDKAEIPALVAQYTADNQGDYTSALVKQGRIDAALKYQTQITKTASDMAGRSAQMENAGRIAAMRVAAEKQIAEARMAQSAALANARMAQSEEHFKEQMKSGRYSVDPNAIEPLAQAISKYVMQPPSSWAQSTPYGQAVMARVFALNPQYSQPRFDVVQKAMKDFATGKQGDTVRSLNVATYHLDVLRQVLDALGNGDVRAANQIRNSYEKQTGNALPTNLNAVKQIVMDEVNKAVVPGGGGQAERQALMQNVSAASSPQQIAGVIGSVEKLMGGQLAGLARQYRANTGLDNFSAFLDPHTVNAIKQYDPELIENIPGLNGPALNLIHDTAASGAVVPAAGAQRDGNRTVDFGAWK